MELAKSFEPGDLENHWYARWESAGYFKPHMDLSKPSFCIQLPPPNVTGTLHMGHAFNQTIMDGLTRYHRMKGDNTSWVPGTDHAGIATQIVVERQLAEQGVSRHDLGREDFISKVWEWKAKSGGTITQQMRRVGCSVDWEREYFTMDATRAEVVTEVFVRLFEQGLIYRGKRLVNWDPKLGTAVSDLEVISEEEDGHMWHIRYPVVGSDDAVIVATTRPETLLGDVAVAVNPNDERYQHLVGKQLQLPLTGRQIPVIADDYVDAAFGTGFVKITPAHDFNDYQVGKRHATQLINVMSLEAKILAKAQVFGFDGSVQGQIDLPAAYAGLSTAEARKAMVADLDAAGGDDRAPAGTGEIRQRHAARAAEPARRTRALSVQQWQGHDVSPAQIALSWTMRQPGIIAIPKAGNVTHVEDNFRSLSIHLTEEDLHDLDTAFPAPARKIPLAGW